MSDFTEDATVLSEAGPLAIRLWDAHRRAYAPDDQRQYADLSETERGSYRRVAILALRMTHGPSLTEAYWRGAIDLAIQRHEKSDWSTLSGHTQATLWYDAKAAVYGFCRFLMGSTHVNENRVSRAAVQTQAEAVQRVRSVVR